MNPSKVRRDRLNQLPDLPNVGPATAADLKLLGITCAHDLVGRDPHEMYHQLSKATNCHQDPCVLDVFISITEFMKGAEARPWWEYTPERKRLLQQKQG